MQKLHSEQLLSHLTNTAPENRHPHTTDGPWSRPSRPPRGKPFSWAPSARSSPGSLAPEQGRAAGGRGGGCWRQRGGRTFARLAQALAPRKALPSPGTGGPGQAKDTPDALAVPRTPATVSGCPVFPALLKKPRRASHGPSARWPRPGWPCGTSQLPGSCIPTARASDSDAPRATRR